MMVVLTHSQMNVCLLLKLPELLPTAALSTSSRASTGHTAAMCCTATWKAAAMIKHPCVDGLYIHRLKFAKLGMVYCCFTTIIYCSSGSPVCFEEDHLEIVSQSMVQELFFLGGCIRNTIEWTTKKQIHLMLFGVKTHSQM